MTEPKLRKGGLAVITDPLADCRRPLTRSERAEWYRKWGGMGEDGESKLAPVSTYCEPDLSRTYVVLKARTTAQLNWGRSTGKLVLLCCTVTGEEFYVGREFVRAII
jgi:hypothetical protein